MRVDGASLATESPVHGLAERFDSARAFQNRTVEWIHDGDEPVAVLRAPTGAGKTATFPDLVDTSRMTLLVYPTNALLRQQQTRLKQEGVDVAVLDSTSLDGHGLERTNELKRTVNHYATDHDAVVTNPDVLQAVLQNMYAGNHAMEFFDQIDAVVYDEFHYYDALAASGILLQIKVLDDREYSPRILLASATPNEDFVDFVDGRLSLDVRRIEATYDPDGQQFRHPVTVDRREETRILDSPHDVATALAAALDGVGEYDEPRVALVFNSAADSNEFHEFLEREYSETVFPHVEKDNGFDTDDDAVDLDSSTFYVLNTTSKGEVGLDYDIRTLFMETPYPSNAADFLQRFGRAGRQGQATIHVFGLGQGPWGDDVSFSTFVDQVYEGLGTSTDGDSRGMPLELLGDLVGLRAAHALRDREREYGWIGEEVWRDFASVDRFDRWHGFLRQLDDELDAVGDGLGGKYTQQDRETSLLRFTDECLDVFRGLRGQSLSATIQYPRGDREALTNYSLVRTLRHYDIDRVESGSTFHVVPQAEDEPQGVVTARLPGYEDQPDPYHEPTSEVEDRLQTRIHREIDRTAEAGRLALSTSLLHRFYRVVRIVDAVIPERLTTSDYEIDIETDRNGSPEITVEDRPP